MAVLPKPPENAMGRRIATAVVILGIALVMWPFAQRQGSLPVETWTSPDGTYEIVSYEMPVLWGEKGKGYVRLIDVQSGKARQQTDVPDIRAITGVTWDKDGAEVAGLGRMDFPKPEGEGDAAPAEGAAN